LPDDWLRPVREAGIARFTAEGFPSTRDEDWRYTDLGPVADRSLAYLTDAQPADESAADLPPDSGDSLRVLFINGRPVGDQRLPEINGLALVPLMAAGATARERIMARLQDFHPAAGTGLADLNASFLTGGLLIEVAPGARIEQPLEILFQGDGRPVAAQPRLLVSAGAGSELTLIEQYAGTGPGLTNAVTDLRAERGARVRYVKLQAESAETHHVALQRVSVSGDGRVEVVHLDLGAALSRNDLQIELTDPGAEVHTRGLFLADGEAHIDNHIRVDHHARDTVSTEICRGIAAQSGKGVFNGKIVVHPGADGTDAKLTNRNLLLSGRAEIDTKPELEIYADDVKCAHGATTGQLDEQALFYLRSRGLASTEARSVLVNAFAAEVVDCIPLARLRDGIRQRLAARLAMDAEVDAT
jgi:Fe-S cluster assembly protein SufD